MIKRLHRLINCNRHTNFLIHEDTLLSNQITPFPTIMSSASISCNILISQRMLVRLNIVSIITMLLISLPQHANLILKKGSRIEYS